MAAGKTTSAGFPILGVLTLIFVTLKLAGVGVVSTWSWWWVLSPLWIVFGLVFLLLFVAGLAFVLKEARKQSRR